jgi:hypothetical protein
MYIYVLIFLLVRSLNLHSGLCCAAGFTVYITAIGSTKGANENFPVWDVFKEFPRSRSVSFVVVEMNMHILGALHNHFRRRDS